MVFKLEPIEIVAICLASLSVLLIISYSIYKLTKSCGLSSSSASTTPIHDTRERGHQDHYYNYGGNDNPYMNYPYSSEPSTSSGTNPSPNSGTHNHVQASPSTGHTTLVTPSTTGGGSMKKYQQQGQGHKLRKGGMTISSPWSHSKDKDLQEDNGKDINNDLVVVTYEDGLRKLGIKPIPFPIKDLDMDSDMDMDREYDNSNIYSQQRFENKFRNVPPINTHINYHNNHNNSQTPNTGQTQQTPIRPEMIERESSRRTSHSIVGRGHGAGRRGYLHNTMGSNLLPSYYVETHAGDE